MNALQTHFWAVRDYLSPVLRESKFKEHGRITPDEFVAAGDFLSYKFPTWQWCSGDASKARDYLPKDKQFLISCGVPSLRRVSQIEKGAGVGLKEDDEKLMSFDEDTEGEGGKQANEDDQWVATHMDSQGENSSHRGEIADIPDIPGEEQLAPEDQLTEGQQDDLANRVAGVTLGTNPTHAGLSHITGIANNDLDDIPDIPDIPDMDDMDDDEVNQLGAGVEEEFDPATAATHSASTNAQTGTSGSSSSKAGASNKLLSVRKYDCIITYDKYYQTPRMWLVGYDEHGVPLKPAQIFEDVSSDYAQKTVTIEPFPHGHAGPDGTAASATSAAGVATASIHPCKHASVMKKVIERMNASVVEEQRKAASGANAGALQPAAEKKKKKGWSVSGAVKRVTGAGHSKESDSAATTGVGASSISSTTPAAASASAASSGSSAQATGTEEGEDANTSTEVEGLRVDQYMIIFLKFMASIVPAIEIDATQAL